MQSDKDRTSHQSTPPRSGISQEIVVSPGTKANLQKNYIDQLDRLHQLIYGTWSYHQGTVWYKARSDYGSVGPHLNFTNLITPLYVMTNISVFR